MVAAVVGLVVVTGPSIRTEAGAVVLPRFVSKAIGVMTYRPRSRSRLGRVDPEVRVIRATTPTAVPERRVAKHRSADTRKRQAVVVGQAARPLRRQAERLQA